MIEDIKYIVKLKKFEEGYSYAAIMNNSEVTLLTAGDISLMKDVNENIDKKIIEPIWE